MNIPKPYPTNYPTFEMPKEAYHPLAEKYINEFKSFEDYKIIPKTYDKDGNVIDFIEGMTNNSYIWKQLIDYPIILGITQGVKSDHKPHFHAESECYYVISGKAKTLCDNKFVDLVKGHYFYVPENCIHNTPITSDEGLCIFYWFPQHHTFDNIKYYWKETVTNSIEAISVFDKVDEIRRKYTNILRNYFYL